MPLYEYHCADCHARTEALRPMSKADEPVECCRCHGWHTSRQLSAFVAFSKGDGGSAARAVAGAGGGCGSCAGGHCGTCGAH
jgi:putative FmdB family regulatory protein